MPRVLAPEQFHSLLPLIREPFRTMVLIAGLFGLAGQRGRCASMAGFRLPWNHAIDTKERSSREVADVKTDYSRDRVPLDTG